MGDCQCIVTSEGAKVLASMLDEQAKDIVEPLKGVNRTAQLEEAEILIDVANDLYEKARDLAKEMKTPMKGGRFMGAGQASNIEYSLGYFHDRAANSKDFARANEPLHMVSSAMSSLAIEFRDLADRLTLSCATGKKTF